MINSRLNYFIFLLLLSLIFSGCKITKIINKENVVPMSEKKLYYNIVKNYVDYNSLSLNYSADYNESEKLGGTIRINKDSIIWILDN